MVPPFSKYVVMPVAPGHLPVGQQPVSGNGAEEGSLLVVSDPGGKQVSIQVGFGRVVGRHLVLFAALVVVLGLQGDGGAHSDEAEHHDGDQRPVPQAGQL